MPSQIKTSDSPRRLGTLTATQFRIDQSARLKHNPLVAEDVLTAALARVLINPTFRRHTGDARQSLPVPFAHSDNRLRHRSLTLLHILDMYHEGSVSPPLILRHDRDAVDLPGYP
ncbi:uncharacterized protein METZ01_LOCUS209400 [marine metagenome]|uniref:Uncharacterized protein n=1 Tax=marine metagenome TaxID=408172 RepID=A0A382F0L1_9ZZZZ